MLMSVTQRGRGDERTSWPTDWRIVFRMTVKSDLVKGTITILGETLTVALDFDYRSAHVWRATDWELQLFEGRETDPTGDVLSVRKVKGVRK